MTEGPSTDADARSEPDGRTGNGARWKVVAILLAVFLLGGVAGAFVMRTIVLHDLRATMRGPPAEARAHFRLEAMRRHLDLSDDQVAQLRTILVDAEVERDEAIAPCTNDLDAVRVRVDERVAAVLTDEQRARYEQMAKRTKGKRPRHR